MPIPHSSLTRLRPAILSAALACVFAAPTARATSDVLVDLLAIPGSAGLGAIQRSGYTPYKGAHIGFDLVPLYMYEGKRVFLHASRVGLKLTDDDRSGFDVFFDYRFEGHPIDQTPPVLEGM